MVKLDVAVIGGGISGLSAALYTGHAGLKTIVFDFNESQIKKIPEVRNYLGAPKISGENLLNNFRDQIQGYAEIRKVKVEALVKKGDLFIIQADGEIYEADRVIVATNIATALLESLGLEIGVNENIKSGKIKKVVGVNWEGVTSIPNLYIAGLLADVPSQAIIAAGQGAAVGVRVAQDVTGEKYMWHDS